MVRQGLVLSQPPPATEIWGSSRYGHFHTAHTIPAQPCTERTNPYLAGPPTSLSLDLVEESLRHRCRGRRFLRGQVARTRRPIFSLRGLSTTAAPYVEPLDKRHRTDSSDCRRGFTPATGTTTPLATPSP